MIDMSSVWSDLLICWLAGFGLGLIIWVCGVLVRAAWGLFRRVTIK